MVSDSDDEDINPDFARHILLIIGVADRLNYDSNSDEEHAICAISSIITQNMSHIAQLRDDLALDDIRQIYIFMAGAGL